MATTKPAVPHFPPDYVTADRGYILRNVSIAFLVLNIFWFVLRTISRRLSKTKFGLDDALIIPALIANIGLCIMGICAVAYGGIGRHLTVLAVYDPQKLQGWAKSLLVAACTYAPAIYLSKLSILALYHRIFTNKVAHYLIWIMAAIMIGTAVSGMIVAGFLCQPFDFWWNKKIPGGFCLDTNSFYRWIGIPNLVTDLVMLVMPIHLVWNLHMSRTNKLGLCAVFLTGSVGLIFCILRFNIFFRTETLLDATWGSIELLSWSIVEAGAYLMAACLTTLRPLFLHVYEGTGFSQLRSRFTGGSTNETNQMKLKASANSGYSGGYSNGSSKVSKGSHAMSANGRDGFDRLYDEDKFSSPMGRPMGRADLESGLRSDVKVQRAFEVSSVGQTPRNGY